MNVLKVSSTSDPCSAAGAIANGIREVGRAELQVIGPRAVNQAVKAIAISRGYLAPSGVDVYCIPSFSTVHILDSDGDQEKTAIHFTITSRHRCVGKTVTGSGSAIM